MPVVSQSIRNPIVPVGARTDTCAFLNPLVAPCRIALFQTSFASSLRKPNSIEFSMRSQYCRCNRMTSCIESTLSAATGCVNPVALESRYPGNGPIAEAVRALCRYASPVMIAVIAPAKALASSESYPCP